MPFNLEDDFKAVQDWFNKAVGSEPIPLSEVDIDKRNESILKAKKERGKNLTRDDAMDLYENVIPEGTVQSVPIVGYELDGVNPAMSTRDTKVSHKNIIEGIAEDITGYKFSAGEMYEPSKILYYNYANDEKQTLIGLEKVGTKKVYKQQLSPSQHMVTSAEEVDTFSGIVRVPIPTEKLDTATGMPVMADIYMNIQNQTWDEFMTNMRNFREGWLARRSMDLPEPLPISTLKNPVTVLHYGNEYGNVEYQTSGVNPVAKLHEHPVSLFAKRSIKDIVGPIWDMSIVPLNWIDKKFGTGPILQRLIPYVLDAAAENKGEGDSWIERMADMLRTSDTGLVSMATFGYAGKTSSDILKISIDHPTHWQSAEEGSVAWTEEDIKNFIEGKDEQFVTKFIKDYVAGRIFIKALRNTVFNLFGTSPAQAERFVRVLNGLEEPPKKMKKYTGWKTGFEHWLESLGKDKLGMSIKKAKNNPKFKEQWKNLLDSKKTQFTNVAFSDFMRAKFSQEGMKSLQGLRGMMLKNKYDYANSPGAWMKWDRTADRLSSFGGSIAEEFLGPAYYMPFAFITNYGGTKLFNSKWYQRAVQDPTFVRPSTLIAFTGIEGGKGFGSALDFLLFKLTGEKPIDTVRYNAAKNKLIKQREEKGLPPLSNEEIELELRITQDIKNPASETMPRHIFMVTLEDGQEIPVGPGAPLYNKVVKLSDEINSTMDDVEISKFVQGLKNFKKISKSLLDLGKQIGGKENPATRLHAKLGSVIELFTTRVYMENLAERVDFGRFRGLGLGSAEAVFQQNKENLQVLAKLTAELLPYVTKGQTSNTLVEFLSGIKNFMDNHTKFVNEALSSIRAAPKVYKRMLNQDIYTEDNANIFDSEIREMNAAIDALHINSLQQPEANTAAAAGKRLEEIYMARHVKLQSIVSNYLHGTPSIYSKTGTGKMFEDVLSGVDKAQKKWGTELYQPMLAKAKGIYIEGENVNNFFTQMENVIRHNGRITPDQLSGEYRILFEEMFESSLERSVKKFKEQTGDTGIDFGIDLDNPNLSNVQIYEHYLKQKEKQTISEDAMVLLDDLFDDLQLNAQSIVRADQFITGRKYYLDQKVENKTHDGDDLAELDNLNKIKANITNLIKKTDTENGTDIFTDYKRASDVYATYLAPSKYGFFYENYEKGVLRIDKQIKLDATQGAKGKKVYKKGKERDVQLEKLGEYILDRPLEAAEMLRIKFGEPVVFADRTTGHGIVNAVQAEDFNLVVERAITLALVKRGKNMLTKAEIRTGQGANVEYNLSDYILSIYTGPLRSNIQQFEDAINNNQIGIQAWDRTWKEDGTMNFRTDTLWYIDPKDSKKNQTLADNVGPRNKIFNYDESNASFFSKELDVAVQLDKKLAEQMKNYKGKISIVNDKVEHIYFQMDKILQNKYDGVKRYLLDKKLITTSPDGILDISNPDELYELLIKDGSGHNINELKKFLYQTMKKDFSKNLLVKSSKEIKDIRSREAGLIGEGGVGDGFTPRVEEIPADAKKEIDNFVNQIVLQGFSRKILKFAGEFNQIVPNKVNSKQAYAKQEGFIDVEKAREELLNAGPIIKEMLGEKRFKQFGEVVEWMITTQTAGAYRIVDVAAEKGLRRSLRDKPEATATSSVLAKLFAWKRGVVGGQWLAVEGAFRNLRMGDAAVITMLLTSNVSATGDSLLDLLHDTVIKKRYGQEIAKRWLRLMPEALYNSQVSYDAHNGDSRWWQFWHKIDNIKLGTGKYKIDTSIPEGMPLVEQQMDELLN